MIHTARQSPKFTRLVRQLRATVATDMIDIETIAIGILERLWHMAIVGCQRGDIGKYDNESIAESVGWFGDADVIVGILVTSGWLDEDAEFRLVIHDWSTHAPGFVKRNIGRQGGFARVAKSLLDDSSEQGSALLPTQESKEEATPNITQHNITQRNQEKDCDEPVSPTSSPPTPSNGEPQKQPKADPPEKIDPASVKFPFFPTVPGKKSGGYQWELTAEVLESLSEAYPAVDVKQESRRAHAWIRANLSNRKTFDGMERFLFRWFSRTQNNARPPVHATGVGRPDKVRRMKRYGPKPEEKQVEQVR